VRCGWDDGFARNWQETAFGNHHQEDGRVADGFERTEIPCNKRLKKCFEHRAWL
jgi:hypothetical protein